MSNLHVLDIEYVIKPDFQKLDEIIIGVVSKKMNCSTWMRFTNDKIKEEGLALIIDTLKAMTDSLIYQHKNNLLVSE